MAQKLRIIGLFVVSLLILSLGALCALQLRSRYAAGEWLNHSLQSRPLVNNDKDFALEIINGTLLPRLIEVVPDSSYQGVACHEPELYRAILETWDGDKRSWVFARELNPMENSNAEKAQASMVSWRVVWPGSRICAGWFRNAIIDSARQNGPVRIVVLERYTKGRSDLSNPMIAVMELAASK